MPQGKKKQPNGNQTPPENEDDDNEQGSDDEELTDGQKGQIVKLINSAVSAQLARKLPAAIEAGIKPLVEKLDALKGRGDDAEEDDENQGGADGGSPAAKKGRPDPRLAKMLKKQEQLERQLAEEKAAREAEKAARQAATIESELSRALTDLGVDSHRLRGALAIHKGSAMVDEESGAVIFRVKRDGWEEDLDPAAYLKEWVATDEGKSYLAPTGSSGGAGARSPRQSGPARKPAPNTPEARAERAQQAKTDLLGAVSQLVAGGSIAIE